MTPLEAVARGICLRVTGEEFYWGDYVIHAKDAIEALAANVADEMGERAKNEIESDYLDPQDAWKVAVEAGIRAALIAAD